MDAEEQTKIRYQCIKSKNEIEISVWAFDKEIYRIIARYIIK